MAAESISQSPLCKIKESANSLYVDLFQPLFDNLDIIMYILYVVYSNNQIFNYILK